MRFVVAAFFAVLLSGCMMADFGSSDRYQTDFHYSYGIQSNGRVNLDNFNGPVEISGWDQDKIEITGVKYAGAQDMRDAIRIEIHNSPDSIDIRTVRPSGWTGNAGARYKINVPRKAVLERITTSNGAIRVRDVASAEHLKSSNGSIRVDNVGGGVDARTSNSSIEMESIQGGATMKTSNGRIRAENIAGPCEADTSNNSITIRLNDAPVSPLKLTTSNGAIDLNLAKAPRSDIRAETRNSAITIHLPADTTARVKADTSNSSVSSDFDIAGEHVQMSRNHLDGMIGNGGPSIDLSTSNGHIRIAKGNVD